MEHIDAVTYKLDGSIQRAQAVFENAIPILDIATIIADYAAAEHYVEKKVIF